MGATSDLAGISEAICELFGAETGIERKQPVSGGDINQAYCLDLTNGEHVFLKSNHKQFLDGFQKEASGLKTIKSLGEIQCPEVLAFGTDDQSAFLLLSYLESGSRNRDFFEKFGRSLAKMHAAPVKKVWAEAGFGFFEDNYIGLTRQKNTRKDSWIEFFAECRLKPQFEMAAAYFDASWKKSILRFLDTLDRFLIEPEQPALLHGDLWGGNFMIGPDGDAWLIDPAVYVGHREADLAMTELFGGFSGEFYQGYQRAYPLQEGYADRRDLYNLYHLLNHLNLFGAHYYPSVLGILKRYCG